MAERKPGRFPASQAPSCPVDAGSAHSPRMRVVCRNASAIAAIGSFKGALPPIIHLFMRIDVRDRAALLPCGRNERFKARHLFYGSPGWHCGLAAARKGHRLVTAVTSCYHGADGWAYEVVIVDRVKFLVFGYNLPAEPTRVRVSIWRRLKKLGAVNVKQSLWFLPYSEENLSHLKEGSQYIKENGGVCLLLESVAVDRQEQDMIVSLFNMTRQAEYAELTVECGKFLQEIERQIANNEFIYAELEEDEAELDKLMSWYEAISARDIFSSSAKGDAGTMMDKARQAYDRYTELVFANETKYRGE